MRYDHDPRHAGAYVPHAASFGARRWRFTGSRTICHMESADRSITPRELAGRPDTIILDVRGKPDDSEIPGSRRFDSDELLADPTLPEDIPLVAQVIVYCGSGNSCRNVAAALRAHGYSARPLEGGYRAWREAGLPVDPRSA